LNDWVLIELFSAVKKQAASDFRHWSDSQDVAWFSVPGPTNHESYNWITVPLLTLSSYFAEMLDISDVKTLPGYQEIPPNCPVWKRTMIEKKNKQLEDDAMVRNA
jgi:hypothetical protein